MATGGADGGAAMEQPADASTGVPEREAGGNVRVAVRVRPFSKREIAEKSRCIISMKGKQTTIIDPCYFEQDIKQRSAWTRTFDFDHSYWSFDRSGAFATQVRFKHAVSLQCADDARRRRTSSKK